MDSCKKKRLERPIFRPAIWFRATATVTTPMPPIWMRIKIMICPKGLQPVAVSTAMRPVTQVEDVAVKRAVKKDAPLGPGLEMGSIRSSVPNRMIPAKPNNTAWAGVRRKGNFMSILPPIFPPRWAAG